MGCNIEDKWKVEITALSCNRLETICIGTSEQARQVLTNSPAENCQEKISVWLKS